MSVQDQVLSLLPPAVKAFLEGSSRRDLLRKVNASLLVFDNAVCHLESGAVARFQDEAGPIDGPRLAAASATLLGETAEELSILLLLPPVAFMATRQALPGINKDSLHSALTLQVESLLPANTSPIALAVDTRALEFTDTPVALWARTSTLTELFDAFATEGLFVAAIRPRALALDHPAGVFVDADATTQTLVRFESDVVLGWQQSDKADLEEAEFAAQWQQAITDELGSAADPADAESSVIELDSIEAYQEYGNPGRHQEYSFFPQGALTARKQVEKGRKLMMAAAVFAGLLFLGYIPFLAQSLQFRMLASTLEAQRELSVQARQDQAVVVSFENELGPLYDFPEQRVREAMYTLQAVLSPTQLSALEVSKGIVRLQGTSSEPQAILQRLEGDPMFTEVAFSRATSNDRFFIDLRLSTVNYDAYLVRYFPD